MASSFVNETAEIAVLYAILNDPKQKGRIMQLTKDDFYKSEHQKIFKAMQSMFLAKKEIDLVTVTAAMAEMYGAESGKLGEIAMKIASDFNVGSAWAINSHIETLKSCALRRHVYLIVNSAQKKLEDDSEDTSAVLESVRQQLRDAVVTRHSWKSISDVMVETFEALEKRSRGEELSMPSGVAGLDAAMSGFHPGEYTIVGARPSVGKSALGAQIALSTAQNGYKVGICSREMTSVQYGTRILSYGSEVDPKKLRKGDLDPDDWVQIAQAVNLFSHTNISFMFTAKLVEDLRMEVQKKVDSGDLDMLVIDYVQLLRTKQKFEKDFLRIAYISKMLKDMAVDFGISIIGLAQVNRSAENTMPTLAELRGAGDLEQDADNVIFLHRPKDASDPCVRPQDKAMFPHLKQSGIQYMAIKIAKQRQGETGIIATLFNPKRMRFSMIHQQALPPAPQENED